jgi:type I restriction enzyme S subunit
MRAFGTGSIYKPASFYADDGLACLRMYNIGEGRIVWRDIKRMRLSENEIREYELLPGDLLVNRVNSRELVGKAVAIPTGLERCVFESKNIRVRIRRDMVLPEFVSYRLLSAGSRYFTQNAQQVVGMASISQPQVARFPLPLPPLDEQRRIVAEIEKQFTRLDTGVAALRRVQANLKRYRAAVLKAACEGKLVPTEAELSRSQPSTKNSQPTFETGEQLLKRILAERRKNSNGQGKLREPAAPDTADLPPLPVGWTWATVDQLNLASRPCAYGVLQPGDEVEDGVPFVRVGDIGQGKVDLMTLKRISPAIAAQYPRTTLRGGELAITLVGAIGRTAIIPDSLAGGNTARAVGVVPLSKELSSYWVEIWFRNPHKTAEMISKSHEVARKTLNLEDVRAATVGLPPLVEQTRIVAEVQRRLSVVEELETAVSANLQRASRLRQSILERAFTGELA